MTLLHFIHRLPCYILGHKYHYWYEKVDGFEYKYNTDRCMRCMD